MSAYVSRRSVLRTAGGLGLAAALGQTMAGCHSSGADSAARDQAVGLPTYKRFQGVKPDLAGTDAGVLDAYFSYPHDPVASVTEVPGDGSPVSGMALMYSAPPPAMGSNPYWQAVNKAVNAKVDMTMVAAADYPTKFPTVIAGGSLPDLMLMQVPPSTIPNLPQMLKARFEDLSPYLSGDAILEYPNLANLPPSAFMSGVQSGGLYGVPIVRGRLGAANFIRLDLFKKYGVDPDPKNFQDLDAAVKTLTNPAEKRWAFGAAWCAQFLLQVMNEEPNGWRLDGSNLVKREESEQFKQSLSDLAGWWKAGVIHPDGFSPTQPFKQLFNAGTAAINAGDGYTGYPGYYATKQTDPSFELGLMRSYKRAGGGLAAWPYGSGILSFTGITKQKSPDRVKMLLRLMNYFAAPFGTKEFTLLNFGVEGRDWSRDKSGTPVVKDSASAPGMGPLFGYLGAPAPVLFMAGAPDQVKDQYEYQKAEIPGGATDPTLGLFSNTNATKGATLQTTVSNAIGQIIQGRQPVSSIDDVMKSWNANGGKTIKQEYLDQLNATSGTPR